jgi:hypothetical protein
MVVALSLVLTIRTVLRRQRRAKVLLNGPHTPDCKQEAHLSTLTGSL